MKIIKLLDWWLGKIMKLFIKKPPMRKIITNIISLIWYIIFLILELFTKISIWKWLSVYFPCDDWWGVENSAPCYLEYDIYVMIFLVVLIIINIIILGFRLNKYFKNK